MTTWRDPITGETDPKKPIRAEWAEMVARNPMALAEGSLNAPKIQSEAMNILIASTFAAFTGLDRCDKIAVVATCSVTGSGSGGDETETFEYRLSTDNGSTWGSWTIGVTVAEGSTVTKAATFSAIVALGTTYDAIEFRRTGDGSTSFFALGVQGVSP